MIRFVDFVDKLNALLDKNAFSSSTSLLADVRRVVAEYVVSQKMSAIQTIDARHIVTELNRYEDVFYNSI